MRRSFVPFLCLVICSLLSIASCASVLDRSVPDIPFIGERVVSLRYYNGSKELLLGGAKNYALSLLRSQHDDIRPIDILYRHASLSLNRWEQEPGERGMIGNFEDRAAAKGWQRVSELSVYAPGHSSLLTMEKNGYVLALLGLDDAFTLLPENPGASTEVANRRWQCDEREEARDRIDIGPCPMRGFAPVYVFSNLSDTKLMTQLLDGKEQMKTYPGDAVDSTMTWEELTVSSKGSSFASDIDNELVDTLSNFK